MTGAIVLTGLSFGIHRFGLKYPIFEGKTICIAYCKCGFEVEIRYFNSYGGVKYLQRKWEEHTGLS